MLARWSLRTKLALLVTAVFLPVSRTNERTVNRLLDGELLDLYVAILIVVPVAMFLRSLWS